jgi:hypothetical protein
VGLGKVSDKILEVLEKVHAVVDKALDTAINWVITKAKSLFAKLFGKDKDGKPDERTEKEKTRDKLAAIADAEKLLPAEGFDEKMVRSKLGGIKTQYKLLTLELVVDSTKDQTETIHFTASASDPEVGKPKQVTITLPVKIDDKVLVQYNGNWEISKVSKIDLATQLVWCDIKSGGKRAMSFDVVVKSFPASIPDVIAPFNKVAHGKSSNPYASIPDVPGVGPKKKFTAAQKAVIIAANIQLHGTLWSDKEKKALVPSVQRQKGVPVDPDAAEVDHDYPESLGGWNTYANAVVISNRANIKKSNKLFP